MEERKEEEIEREKQSEKGEWKKLGRRKETLTNKQKYRRKTDSFFSKEQNTKKHHPKKQRLDPSTLQKETKTKSDKKTRNNKRTFSEIKQNFSVCPKKIDNLPQTTCNPKIPPRFLECFRLWNPFVQKPPKMPRSWFLQKWLGCLAYQEWHYEQ